MCVNTCVRVPVCVLGPVELQLEVQVATASGTVTGTGTEYKIQVTYRHIDTATAVAANLTCNPSHSRGENIQVVAAVW